MQNNQDERKKHLWHHAILNVNSSNGIFAYAVWQLIAAIPHPRTSCRQEAGASKPAQCVREISLASIPVNWICILHQIRRSKLHFIYASSLPPDIHKQDVHTHIHCIIIHKHAHRNTQKGPVSPHTICSWGAREHCVVVPSSSSSKCGCVTCHVFAAWHVFDRVKKWGWISWRGWGWREKREGRGEGKEEW